MLPGILTQLNASNPAYYIERPARLGQTGYTVYAYLQWSGFAAALAARTDNPDVVIVVLGANDCYLKLVAPMSAGYAFVDGTGNQWIANGISFGTLLYHWKPNATFFWSLQWFNIPEIQTELATMDSTLIPAVIAGLQAIGMNIHAGIDETTVLGANTATYLLADGLHPTVAGGLAEGTAYVPIITPYFG